MTVAAPSAEIIGSILQELPHGVWVAKAPGGELVYANKTFADIMGMGARDDVKVGEYAQPYGIYDREGRLYPEGRMPFVRALQAKATVMVDDIVIHRSDGGRVFVRAYAKPLLGPDGEVAMVAIIFSDITAEVRAQEESALAQRQISTIVNHAPIAIWSLDREGVITVSEGAGLQSLGVASGELVGKSVFELYADHPTIPGFIRRGLAGESLAYTVQVGEAVLESWIGPLRNTAGELDGIIGVSTDVSERHRAQAKVVQADRLVAMGTLAASVAHEINNPLAYVIESLRLLDEELASLSAEPEAAGARQRLEHVRRWLPATREGLDRVRVITRDLQTFSRTPDEQSAPVDVRRALESALQLVGKTLRERAQLVLEVDELPPVWANEARLVQVFTNLLLNAAQAVEGDASAQEVRVSARVEGAQVSVEISDSGPGIPEQIRGRIFEPFVTTKPVGEGTGLGLFVCRNLIEAMGGTIDAENRPQGGAFFRVRLPARSFAAVEMPAPAAAAAARILIIDDNMTLGRVLADSLRRDGHQTEVVLSGSEALEVLSSDQQFDLVFCDLMMKDLSGMDVYEALRARRPGRERELIFMTGGAFTERARNFLARVPNERLEKPFDIRQEVARRLR
ncbi:MAG: ATP-binding protein [Myxococcota bacterium]